MNRGHKYLINLRDKHIAHSVNPFENVAVGLVLGAAGSADEGQVIGIGSFTMKLSLHDEQGIRQLAAVAQAAQRAIRPEIDRLGEVVREEGAALSAEERGALPRLRLTAPPPESAGKSRRRSS